MRILSIIQPSEMGSDFRFEDDVWKVNFPAGMGESGGVPLSTDANNAIGLGSDDGAFISTDLLNSYALTQDNGSKKINLYRFPVGTEFDPLTATLVSSVNLIELSGVFDDVAIDGDLITFTDADTGLTLTIDTANLQKVSDLVGSDSVEVHSLDGLTTLSVRINPHPDNLIEVTEEGLFVDAANFGGGEGGELDLHQTLAQVEEGLCHVVGNSHLVVPQIELVDVAGNAIGYINDIIGLPVSSQNHGPDHCPKWEPPATNNCRVGKVAVAFVPEFMYGTNPEDSSLEWRIFMNGEDTGYIAAVDLSHPPVVDQPMVMSLTQNDFGDGNDFKGKGWLQDIISEATNGAVSGSYHNGATLLNETNQQVILTLVPNKPITLDEVRYVYNSDEGRSIFELTLDQITAIRNSPGGGPVGPIGPIGPIGPGTVIPSMLSSDSVTPMNLGGGEVVAPMEDLPTIAVLEDYFDEETGVINICLAPNNSGNGGSTGPQISCADATDRFATSGLWYRWTVKLNGATLIENARRGDVIQALVSKGIRVGYEGEMLTTYRNLTNENIRLEFIAGTPDNQWDDIYLEIDKSTNPTLMGYDPLQNNAEFSMRAFFPPEEDIAPERYQRITVCLAPADDWMHWDYEEPDTSTAEITLRNSVKLIDANQGFQIEGEHNLELETGVDMWGDLTWTIRADEPQRREVTLTIVHPDYQDEFTAEFHARKPMIVTLANTHEYSHPFSVQSGLEEAAEITAIEVVTKSGSTLISEPEDEMTIDAAVGAIRIDSLENGSFTHIVQGRFLDTELFDVVKVTFTTAVGEQHVVEVNIDTTGDEVGYVPVSNSQISTVTIGLVDDAIYKDVNTLPIIGIDSPDWSYATLHRINRVGGEVSMNFDFSQRSTYQLYIRAYLGTGSGKLAVLGDCVIGVDDWGELEAEGYTFNQETYNKCFWVNNEDNADYQNITKNNLAYVPKEGPVGMGSMVGMFAGTDLSDPSVDLSGYDVGDVRSMVGVFAHSNFNGNIVGWNMRWVQWLDYAFYASKFRQDISEWCVLGVTNEPILFNHRSRLPTSFKPVWGTCPIPGSDTTVLRHYVEEGDLSEDAGLGSYTLVARGIKPADVTVRLDGQRITDLYSGRDYSTGMETVVFQVRTTRDSEGLLEIKHPPLRKFVVNNLNDTNPKRVDVVKFGKNVEGFELALPFAYKVPNSIPSTVVRLNKMFAHSHQFADAENIEQWDVGNVIWMEEAFYGTTALNANLSNWCTTKVLFPPSNFAKDSGILPENFPVWGTCPVGSNYINTTGEPKYHVATADSFITTESTPTLSGRVSHPLAVLKVYDENAVRYTPAVNNGDGTWTCELGYTKPANVHRLSIEASNSITGDLTGMDIMWVVSAEIEGGYYDRATSELVCTSPEGMYVRILNGRNTNFTLSGLMAVDSVRKDVTFCVTETARTLADFKASGPLLGDPRIEPLENSESMYMSGRGDNSYLTFKPTAAGKLSLEVNDTSLGVKFENNSWGYIDHPTVGGNKAIFIHLKPIADETEARVKIGFYY